MPNLKWNPMKYSNVLRKRQITQHKISSQKELAPKRIKIRNLSVHVHKKSLGYQFNSLQGKIKGPHGTRSRKHNLLHVYNRTVLQVFQDPSSSVAVYLIMMFAVV